MYMDKQVKRGYNEYIRLDEGIGKDAMMDVALLVMEDGDTWSCEEPEKEVAALVFDGKCTIKWENESYDVDRPNPFDYNPSCLHVCKGVKFEIIAHGPCNIYIQKTLNEKTFPSKMYKPEDTDTWARGNKGELMGCIKRDVRTCFDLDNAPYSNMVLGRLSTCRASGPLTRRIIIRSRSATSTASTSRWASAQAGATARFTRPITTVWLSSPIRCTLR